MGFKEAMEDVLAGKIVVPSEWKFVTSAGGELSVGTPIVHVGVNATAGALWVKRDSDTNPTTLRYGGIGASASLSLIPSPANFSFSIPQMPSAGRIYKLPFAGRTLSRNELNGAFVFIEVAADVGAGVGGGFMFIGGSARAAMAVSGLGLAIPAILATATACVRFGGMAVTVLPVNIGASLYVGGISS